MNVVQWSQRRAATQHGSKQKACAIYITRDSEGETDEEGEAPKTQKYPFLSIYEKRNIYTPKTKIEQKPCSEIETTEETI